jgi:hypothetical protein
MNLESMAIELPAFHGHPNREPFRGVLTLVDTPSDKAPAGSRGHRVVLTRVAAERALPSLLGMALDYSPALDRHDTRRKVGVITRAEIVAVCGFVPAQYGCSGERKSHMTFRADFADACSCPRWRESIQSQFAERSPESLLRIDIRSAQSSCRQFLPL